MRTAIISLAILVFSSCSAQKPAVNSTPDEPVIQTASGMVRGVKEGDGTSSRDSVCRPLLWVNFAGDLPSQLLHGKVRDAKRVGPQLCAQEAGVRLGNKRGKFL